MSQGETFFYDLNILETRSETPELTHLTLSKAPADFRALYQIPGQYVQAKVGAMKPGFFAIANAPGEETLDLLIKRGSPTTDAIAVLKSGEKLQVSAPLGKGFPLQHARGNDLFLIGVGSGMAPLRAVAHKVIAERAAYQSVTFVYGARTPQSFPYEGETARWKEKGIDYVRVCSQPGGADVWQEEKGRVQNILLSRKPEIRSHAVAFLCGMKPMVEEVRAALVQLGLPAERVYLNF